MVEVAVGDEVGARGYMVLEDTLTSPALIFNEMRLKASGRYEQMDYGLDLTYRKIQYYFAYFTENLLYKDRGWN